MTENFTLCTVKKRHDWCFWLHYTAPGSKATLEWCRRCALVRVIYDKPTRDILYFTYKGKRKRND